jgi:rhodanese-related sulfurtransferase
MDTALPQDIARISPAVLAARLGRADAPLVLDVRRAPAFAAASSLLPGALRVAPDDTAALRLLPRDRTIVAYCVHGHEVSQGVARALATAGCDAAFLEGGIAGWGEAGLPVMAKAPALGIPAAPGAATRWVTRERPKIDRIACPWLVRRFIDPLAEFLYVPAGEVREVADRERAIPYDVPEVRISHRGPEGERCSFDTLLAECGLDDPCLKELAHIVRGADTGKPALTPQSAGLLAISLGLSVTHPDDHAMLQQGMVIYDALYAWIRSARAEVHNAALFRQP